jgi:hypothetical protein
VHADDDHGEVGDDLARRRHGGSIPGRRSSSYRGCWIWRNSSTASASTSPAIHQVSSSALLRPRVCVMTASWMRMKIDGFRCDSCLHHPAETPLGFDATAAGLAAGPWHRAALLAVRSGTTWACTRTTTTARWGTTLPGAAMADPSQEEAPAATEPAGDGRPYPGRPPRHRPQAIRSAILRCSVLQLGVMTASWMRMKMMDFVAEIAYSGYIQFVRTRKRKNHVLTYGVNHFLFLTSSAHGVAGRPHIVCSGYS